MKFRLRKGKGSVNRLVKDGKVYNPGDVVDLPPSYRGQHYLEVVERKVEKPMEPVEIAVPLPAENIKSKKKPKGSKKTK